MKKFLLLASACVASLTAAFAQDVPTYTSLAEMKEAATGTRVNVSYEAKDLLVTGVGVRGNNRNVYVSDGQEGFLIYGGDSEFKKGDKISGTLTGQLSIYNNAAQIQSPDYTNVSVTSSDNEVVPMVITLAQLAADADYAYGNKYVQVQGVKFTADALSSSNITMTDEEGTTVTLRDNFNVLGNVIFDQTKTHNVSGYVAYYNKKGQLYACSADDVQMVTNLKDPEVAFAESKVILLPTDEQTVSNPFTTVTDGAKTFTSSNEAVATVDAEGNVTVTGKGFATITAETAETETYLAGKASYTLYVIEGAGTFEDPYTTADVQCYNKVIKEKVWVKGTVIGSMQSQVIYPAGDEKTQASNLVIGTEELPVPVQLSSGSKVREMLNLIDHPENQGVEVWVYGLMEDYFSMPGVKGTSDCSLDGESTLTAIAVVTNQTTGKKEIYSLDGRRLDAPVKGLNIINGRKVLVK